MTLKNAGIIREMCVCNWCAWFESSVVQWSLSGFPVLRSLWTRFAGRRRWAAAGHFTPLQPSVTRPSFSPLLAGSSLFCSPCFFRAVAVRPPSLQSRSILNDCILSRALSSSRRVPSLLLFHSPICKRPMPIVDPGPPLPVDVTMQHSLQTPAILQ